MGCMSSKARTGDGDRQSVSDCEYLSTCACTMLSFVAECHVGAALAALRAVYRGSAKLADRNLPRDSNGKAGVLSLLQGSRMASAPATPRRP